MVVHVDDRKLPVINLLTRSQSETLGDITFSNLRFYGQNLKV